MFETDMGSVLTAGPNQLSLANYLRRYFNMAEACRNYQVEYDYEDYCGERLQATDSSETAPAQP